MNIFSDLNIRGHLTISKVTKDGEELIFDDNNQIVSGMGWALATFFSKLGSNTITDYQIDRFQLGVSGNTANQVSSTFQLSGPLTSVTEYTGGTVDSNLYAFSANQWKNDAVVTVDHNSGGSIFFASIPFSKVTKIDSNSVRYSIFIDEDSCNNLTRGGQDIDLSEIGLFMKNPKASSPEASILVAYKYFTNIRKTSDFGLLFRWTISFG